MGKTPKEVVSVARKAFESGRTLPLEFRERQLKNLLRMCEENESEMVRVLREDLNKPKSESMLTEIVLLKLDIEEQIKNLKLWAEPEKPKKPIANIMDEALIYNDPYGVVLVVGAWNYPINVTFIPITGAIAAGNCVVIKPSEVSSATADFIAKTIPKYLDNECYQVVCGGVSETTELLQEKFDYIFFTGSTAVGKIIHTAANKNLTPVTLELGGKSPVYLDETANLEVAVRRILWGKCVNAGQTCIAPDYMLCTKKTEEKFIQVAKKILSEWYGDDVKKSKDLCRIVTENHFNRISKFLKGNGKIAIGGKSDPSKRFIEPTILIDVQPNDPIMQEEIFGPVLPILTISDHKEAIKFINNREKPLALYIFSADRSVIDKILESTSSGGVCVNDTLMHMATPGLPFGGVGPSGMGRYHGKASFDTFVHKKSILVKNLGAFGEKMMAIRYPPYTDEKAKKLTGALSKGNLALNFGFLKYGLVFLAGAVIPFVSVLLK